MRVAIWDMVKKFKSWKDEVVGCNRMMVVEEEGQEATKENSRMEQLEERKDVSKNKEATLTS
jgi:hypothetical protein